MKGLLGHSNTHPHAWEHGSKRTEPQPKLSKSLLLVLLSLNWYLALGKPFMFLRANFHIHEVSLICQRPWNEATFLRQGQWFFVNFLFAWECRFSLIHESCQLRTTVHSVYHHELIIPHGKAHKNITECINYAFHCLCPIWSVTDFICMKIFLQICLNMYILYMNKSIIKIVEDWDDCFGG